VHTRDELVASLMVDALQQADEVGSRRAALVHFVEQVGNDGAAALREALAKLEATEAARTSDRTRTASDAEGVAPQQ
jgi:predicted transcriptional regulator